MINMKNRDNECHIQRLNPQERDPQWIDRKIVEELNYQGIEFPVCAKYYTKVEVQNSINVNVFGYEDKQFYPIFVSKGNNANVLDSLLTAKDRKQHYVLIKDFNRMMYSGAPRARFARVDGAP